MQRPRKGRGRGSVDIKNNNNSNRSQFYKLSVPIVILLWGLVFLLNSWISHGDHQYTDEPGPLSLNVSAWDVANPDETALNPSNNKPTSGPLDSDNLTETCPEYSTTTCTHTAQVNETGTDDTHSGSDDTGSSLSGSGEPPPVEALSSAVNQRKEDGKTVRLTRAVVPLGLDEFKHKALNSRSKYVPGARGGVIHRVEAGGAEYNYASSAKGAKVLESNKEAKGSSNILNKDKDKYLRNPCSVDDKFVVIELSEETLVDTIEIANFEHYSSNLKDFELLGSLVYPTDTWDKLGNFSAGNFKHAQRFALLEPKWVRYLKLNILSHHGSEFYCTLSCIEVYGVDAVERMLEDLISVPDNHYPLGETADERDTVHSVPESAETKGPDQNTSTESVPTESSSLKNDSIIDTDSDSVGEVRHLQVSRMPGDTVLKILMQKVRALDLNLSVLERYLEELNSKYGSIFKELDKEMEENHLLIEEIRSDIRDVFISKDALAKDVDELMAWKSLISMQLDGLVKDNALLRSDVRRVQETQLHMESKGILVFLVSVMFGFSAFVILCTDIVYSVHRSQKSRKFCWMNSSWLFLFLSCCTTIIILVL